MHAEKRFTLSIRSTETLRAMFVVRQQINSSEEKLVSNFKFRFGDFSVSQNNSSAHENLSLSSSSVVNSSFIQHFNAIDLPSTKNYKCRRIEIHFSLSFLSTVFRVKISPATAYSFDCSNLDLWLCQINGKKTENVWVEKKTETKIGFRVCFISKWNYGAHNHYEIKQQLINLLSIRMKRD